ncbi:MAG TPA: DNA helicase UvrD [Gammaproteobacteria bacterium]|nr:DNA helicase UvrD [Gammaproteobacteria bacterium]
MSPSAAALAPDNSITVLASAGTGKTWLLVSRLLRLLLEGAAPDAILAITFTRKAAAEMQNRLAERLLTLGGLEGEALAVALEHLGLSTDAATLSRARHLYENTLHESRRIRVTTFHAFCQELLQRFPLEAGVPAGFELAESTGYLQEEAWDALTSAATAQPDGATAAALEALFERLGGQHNCREALAEFLRHRSDWWAYTEGQAEPAAYATAALQRQLDAAGHNAALEILWSEDNIRQLRQFAATLRRLGTATEQGQADTIDAALAAQADPAARLALLIPAFFTQKHQVRQRKATKTAEKCLGTAGQARFLATHQRLLELIEQAREQQRRLDTLALNRAWYRAGSALLEHYQRLKRERRILDFADLEWQAYTLLNRGENALWVQYKLDQRIDHLLVDEFQDTNPTQWRLLLPLLEELAAGGSGRRRSVFLVGDLKQSIYSFRRADPDLFPAARDWLAQRLGARTHTLVTSYRSAPAIMDVVNKVFGDRQALPDFPPHATHHADLWGRVELLPLATADAAPDTAPPAGLRNPLQQPRPELRDRRHFREGQAIAARLKALFREQKILGTGAQAKTVGPEDVVILVRRRTHLGDYEAALREAGIPYLSATRGTLLNCVEVQDMVALLTTLITPYDNLALATVLRSPLFDAGDRELTQLAACRRHGTWWEGLRQLAGRVDPASPLGRAAHYLPMWQQAAQALPVHDLLDRLYAQGNVLARYLSAFPAHLRPRAEANLTRFLELALETDSGRYPSLHRFLDRLSTLRDEDAPDEAPQAAGGVRLMTIHAAKGLEAPVVVLADAAAAPRGDTTHKALVHWPSRAAAPRHMLLAPRSHERDAVTRQLLDSAAQRRQREDANLLYVALTRARQLLIVSGAAPAREGAGLGWYGQVATALGDAADAAGLPCHEPLGYHPPPVAAAAAPAPPPPDLPDGISRPVPAPPFEAPSPSHQHADPATRDGDEDGLERGRAIHCFLDWLSTGRPQTPEPPPHLLDRLCLPGPAASQACWEEALALIRHPGMQELFDPRRFDCAYNEIPICYREQDREVHGIIDRLLLRGGECLVIDYKTHRCALNTDPATLAAPYREQLRAYAAGVARLWPDKTVRMRLVFTASATAWELD